ncbi:unnamed protein product [Schistosoma rodhaini]|uniref:Uncharacterized protein n=1 Tax=Schistosoma rodhaini TaxID=6188 RepID=A0AA85G6U7_9TREM|nr:unnamed protein product [Schistosoma rodhaini]CAH8604183.1 unnamed protein product [Schistosoma rodhaini]
MSLGSEACILKLKEEVYLLHDVVERVNKRANMKVAYSWKFPGKSAFETKILPVLSKCNFSTSNKPSNTMLHVFLLEMIIDRCLLIFQILSHLCKTVCHHLCSSNEDSNSLSSCVHEHVSVVSYLISLISVNAETKEAVYLKYDEENHETSYEVERFADRKIAADAIKWIADVERYYKSSSQAPSELTDKNGELVTRSQGTQATISENQGGNFSQLFQSVIQVLSRCLVKPMDTYNLPSETGRFISDAKHLPGWIGCKADESRSLLSSVERDITRLIKYLETNSSPIKIMEEQLNLVKKENVQLSKEILDKQYEFNTVHEKLSKEIRNLSKRNIELKEENTNIKTEIENLHKMIKTKESRTLELENQCEVIKNNIENLQKLCDSDTIQPDEINLSSNPSCIIESCLLKFRHKLENTIDECQRISKLLEMKEMENQNMNSQLSMLTTKHEKLSTRLNQLTTLNEQLEEEIALKENSIQYLNSQLTNSNQKVSEIENSLNDIKSKLTENEDIRKSTELNLEQVQLENKELHEKLNKLNEDILNMAQYPDLNGPITFENNEKSVDEELKGQIQANELRITLLVEQTKRLRNALLVINDKRQNMNNNHNNEIQFMEENTELLSPKIDHSILSDDDNNNDDGDATSIIRPNSISSLDNMSSDNRSVKEDNCRIRQKTYTKSNINSSEVNGNHQNVQLWSGPNATRKGIVFLN